MLTLSARKLEGNLDGLGRRVFRVTERANIPRATRNKHALLHRDELQCPDGFGLHIHLAGKPDGPRNIFLPPAFEYLSDGDIVVVDEGDKAIRTLYRRSCRSNSLLVTERCNHHCIMCSQPPRDVDDSYIVRDLLEAIPLMAQDTPSIGITGGEPTLLGDDFVKLLRSLKNNLPATAVHVLSNGRNFRNLPLCHAISQIGHGDLIFGIPIYSAEPDRHNYVVQAENAWSETIEGIINLKRFGIGVEIRLVMHKDTIAGMEDLAEFIRRNLTMVDHVAFMGLERMGFAATNWKYLFVNPRDYAATLGRAVRILDHAKIRTSIYNTPLCMLPDDLHSFAEQSISDWKNDFPEECAECSLKPRCAGCFSSTVEALKGLVRPKRAQPRQPMRKKTLDRTASAFVSEQAEIIFSSGLECIADVACGDGRNLTPFLGGKPKVHCYDINVAAISDFKSTHPEIELLCHEVDLLDSDFELPQAAFSLVILVHFYEQNLFRKVIGSIKPGGILLLETIDSHGANYLQLPRKGEVQAMLRPGFEILETRTGDIQETDRQTVKVCARKALAAA